MPQVGITEYSTPNVLLLLYTLGFVCVCVSVCIYVCIYIAFVVYFFFYKKRILMPHIDFTFYVQTKGKL